MGHYDPGRWQKDSPFTRERNEMSFLSTLVLTIVLLLSGALIYRHQTEILGFFQRLPAAAPQLSAVQQPEPTVVAPKVLAPARPPAEDAGHIYRCGNTYSTTSCEGGGR